MNKVLFLVAVAFIAGGVLIPLIGWKEGLFSAAGIVLTIAFTFLKK